MSSQSNRKQQRLARDLSRSEGTSYQVALSAVRGRANKSDARVNQQGGRLFDETERLDPVPARRGEDSFAFLNRASSAYWSKVRAELERWYELFPDEGGDLRNRFRNPAPQQHYPAWWELYLHRVFMQLGFEVEVHPPLRGSRSHPDFLATRGNSKLYIEALTVFSGIEEPGRHGARETEVLKALEAIKDSRFHLAVRFDRVGANTPRRAPITREAGHWLGGLDPDSLITGFERDRKVATRSFTFADWSFHLRAIPRLPGHRSEPDHPLLMGPAIAGYVNDVEKLRDALRRKHSRYPNLDGPLLLAVLAMSGFTEDRDVASVLFGSEAISYAPSTGSEALIRQPDGLWWDRSGLTGAQASGVLFGKGIGAHNCAQIGPRLWHHPAPAEGLEIPLPFPTARVLAGELQLEDGDTMPHELLNLAADWPGPEPPFPEKDA